MPLSLKISNVFENPLELISRLKKIKTKTVINKALAENNWYSVYYELIYRIEFYAENKVLNYRKTDLFVITQPVLTNKVTIEQLAEACVKKYVKEIDNLNESTSVNVADIFDTIIKKFNEAKIPSDTKLYDSGELLIQLGWDYPDKLVNKVYDILTQLGIKDEEFNDIVSICAEGGGRGKVIKGVQTSGGRRDY